ncbi:MULTISPECIES: hypothetical protein [Streptacidiphilus]|uniref:Uncharacterized protein n=1 Tax=Streptacidiphilus cavernicola TaxID=3342716 RepID=A0ABV6UVN0_9ACTN|nr:hypothetical protein [Streptacidiphilus jeojiense]
MRIKVRERTARRKRRLMIGIPAALAVAAAGGLAFADVTPPSTPVNGAGSNPSAMVNGAAAPFSMANTAPTMMSNGTLTANLSVTTVRLASAFSFLSPSTNGIPTWTRTVTAVAPNGTLEVAWQASNSIHVTPVNRFLQRSGPDVVINGAQEVGGLVAFNNGFTLLTRIADHNRNGETAAALIHVANNHVVFVVKLTGTASRDTSPVLNGQLAWNGSKYTTYFTVHGTSGSRSGQWGDKMVPVSSSGRVLSGGWEWGCRGDVGRSLSTGSANYAICYDDGGSGASKSSSADQITAGNGSQVVALSAPGPVTYKKNSLTWSVNPRWKTDQVVLVFLSGSHWKTAKSVALTGDQSVQNINVHIAPYGRNAMLASWDSYRNGQYTGTHLRLIDLQGRFLTADLVLTIHVSGNIVVLRNGDLAWAFVQQTPASYHRGGSWPTTTHLFLARLRVSFSGSGSGSTSSPTSGPTSAPMPSPSMSPSPTPSMTMGMSAAPTATSSATVNAGSHW